MHKKLLSVTLISIFALACGGSNKPAENPDDRTAGEKLDAAAEKTEESAEKASEEAGEKMEEAGDKAKEKTKDEE